jgi:DNA polymerase-1
MGGLVGAKSLIGLKDGDPKSAAQKAAKIPPCSQCERFRFFRTIDWDRDYRRVPVGAKGRVAFVMSPADFAALERRQWKHVICSGLPEFDVSFIPYPVCCENPYDVKAKTSIKVWRGCRENVVRRRLKEIGAGLVVVFSETKGLVSLDGGTEIEHPGNWTEWDGMRVLLAKNLWHPRGFGQSAFAHLADRVRRCFAGSLFWQRSQDFRVVTSSEQLREIREELGAQDSVAVDVETSGLDVLADDFRLKTVGLYWPKVGVCVGYDVEECLDVGFRREVKEMVLGLFANPKVKKICHNLKYELKVLSRVFGMEAAELCEDTMFLAYLFDENRRSNGLKALSGELLDGYDAVVKDFAGAGLKDLWRYNCMDAAYTYRLWSDVFDLGKLGDLRPGIEYVYREVMLPLCRELALMEMRGVRLDYGYMAKLREIIEGDLQELNERIAREFPQTVGKDLGAPKQLADVLFSMLRFPSVRKTKTGESTDKEVLVVLKERHGCALAGLVLEQRRMEKLLSTYVVPYLAKRAEYRLDRVRCSYAQTKNYMVAKGEAKGTVTGRLSSAGPNLQNVPRDKTIKRQFIPSATGRVFLQADLSQAELRIGASLANEEVMLGIYEADGDVHESTGMNCSPRAFIEKYKASAEGPAKKAAFKEIRQSGKSCNFGCLYIGSHLVLMRVAKQNYGVDFSEDEALVAWKAYHEMYPGIGRWHEEMESYISRYGVAISPYGRVRRAPHLFELQAGTGEYDAVIRELLNATVQGSCADFLAQSWTAGGREIRRRGLDKWVVDLTCCAYPVLTVHDNVVFDCESKGAAEEVAGILGGACAKWTDYHREAGWLKCAMKMDFEIGNHWGALEEVDVAADLDEAEPEAA